MRSAAPESRPVALTIAGSDSGGGAGIQADLATMAAHGAYATSVVTAVTAQHTRGVEGSFALPATEVAAQLSAVTDDFAVGAAKTGMLATPEIVETVAARAAAFEFPLVVDPVMVATSGDRLLEPAAEAAYEELVATATLATPNTDEAAVLTGIDVADEASARAAGEALCELGAEAALVTGGHLPGERVRDVLVTPDGATTFEHPRVEAAATHGTGCTLSAAVAARLAAGDDLEAAVGAATDALSRAVRYHYDVGRGPGAVNHLVGLRNDAAKPAAAETAGKLRDVAAADAPEIDVTVVAATPYAESLEDLATAVGPTRGRDGGATAARFGRETPTGRLLLAARERAPALRVAATSRFDAETAPRVENLEWEGSVRESDADDPFRADERSLSPPVAVVDREAATLTALATDAPSLSTAVGELWSRFE